MASLGLFVNVQITKSNFAAVAATTLTLYIIQAQQYAAAQQLQGTVREYQYPVQQGSNDMPPLTLPGSQTSQPDDSPVARMVPYPYVLYQQPQSQQQPLGNYNQQQPSNNTQAYDVLRQGPSVGKFDPYNLLPYPLGFFAKKLVASQNQQNNKKQQKMQKRIALLEAQNPGNIIITPGTAKLSSSPIANNVYGGQDDRIVSWDAWYRRLGIVDTPLMNQSLANHRFPTGVAHLWLTVTPTHQLTAQLLDSTSKRFGQAALEGVQALNGNESLEYPVDSLRKTVSFKWVANHRGKAGKAPDMFENSTIVGDREMQYRQW